MKATIKFEYDTETKTVSKILLEKVTDARPLELFPINEMPVAFDVGKREAENMFRNSKLSAEAHEAVHRGVDTPK